MLRVRVIPCLLLRRNGLVKTVKFENAKYVGDPINTVRIYNEKEVDELFFLDITATPDKKEPPYEMIHEIATECFMPFAYGGGVREFEQAAKIFAIGAEKVVLNTAAAANPTLISRIADKFGSQAVVASIDAKKDFFGRYKVVTAGARNATGKDVVEQAQLMEKMGAGELLLTSVDRDGTFEGYDVELIRRVTRAVHIPVVAAGGAGKLEHLVAPVKEGGAQSVACGSLFVYQGKNRAVLTNYPSRQELLRLFP
jgi:imidazole glycerol-phosphate synthase subunit HisF